MLMLVVVIIIAAVVSGFAGGLITSNSKPPQATIQVKYFQSAHLLMMYHAGGDELSTQKVFIVVRGKDEENGGYSGTMSRITLNKTLICNMAGTLCWASPTGYSGMTVWRAGETLVSNETFAVMNTGGQSLTTPQVSDIGKAFNFEIDSTDGKLISKTDVKIVP
jgi:FlaG/FlaF family flagellin (archaellin)